MAAAKDLTGRQFGRWAVIGRAEEKGAVKWMCRCSCGTERTVAAKGLLAGTSTSCGCLAREKRAASREELSGERFGKLAVLEWAGKSESGASQWKCACDCGEECVVLHSSLKSGKRTSCGCDSKKGKHTAKDISGMKFNMLTALYPTEKRDRKGTVIWHCRCDCGKEADISYDRLKYSTVISCGCQRKKCDQEISNKLTHVAGTSIDAIRSQKRRVDNQTGHTGVYVKKGKYAASITFQQKAYYLGSYSRIETAVQIRQEAKKLLHDNFVSFYEAWKRRADGEEGWGEENPISIHVEKLENGEFDIEILPKLSKVM